MIKHLTRTRVVLMAVLLLFASKQTFAADPIFKRYTISDGLSSNTVYSMIQDAEGMIWVGTEKGLNSFNGYDFKTYSNIVRDCTSLRNNIVYSIYENDDNTLWVGTEDGISVYDKNISLFSNFDTKTPEGDMIGGRIQNIIKGVDGKVWVASLEDGVFVYDKEQGLCRHTLEEYKEDKSQHSYTTSILKDSYGQVWVSISNTFHIIYKYDGEKDMFVPAFPNENRDRLQQLLSYSIVEDNFGTLWFGSWRRGLYEVDRNKGVVGVHLDKGANVIQQIHSVTEFAPGMLMIGSNDGLTIYRTSPVVGNSSVIHYNEPIISNRFVYPILKDKDGGLWVGTYYGGINYLSPNRNYFAGYVDDGSVNGLRGNVVSAFCEDNDGLIWIGTDDGGLNCFNPNTEQFKYYQPTEGQNSISHDNIHGLYVDGDNLWIGTYSGGLNLLNLKTKRFKHYLYLSANGEAADVNSVYSLYKDSRGNLWAGTMVGITMYDPEKDFFYSKRHVNSTVIDIIEINEQIWFATLGKGVFIYDYAQNDWSYLRYDEDDSNSLICNEVSSLYHDGEYVWIGTNNGLVKYSLETGGLEVIEEELLKVSISKIFKEGEELWITTINGIVNYHPKMNQSRYFTTDDGLVSANFLFNSGVQTKSGLIYAGTSNGFNVFHPKQITRNRNKPNIIVTKFLLSNRAVNINDYIVEERGEPRKIVLKHNQNSFGFEYAALSYFAPARNSYAYKLEGFDTKWQYVDNERRASYTNIPHGEYVFHIVASNNDGVWNEEGVLLHLQIVPPIWATTWAKLLYLLLLLFGLYLLFQFLQRREQKKNQRAIDELKREQERETYNSRINFFTIVAHEIRTPLSLIVGPLEKIYRKADKLPKYVAENLTVIDRNSKRMLFLINQILDFRKYESQLLKPIPSKENLCDFSYEIFNYFRSYAESEEIGFNFVCDDESFVTYIDKENLTKVIYNLMDNALKYTNSIIEMEIETGLADDKFSITIRDDGPGVSLEEQENIFKPFYQVSDKVSGTGIGLYLIKKITEGLQGEIKIDNSNDTGLAISVTLPPLSLEQVESYPENGEVESTSLRTRIYKVTDGEEAEGKKESSASATMHTLLIVEDSIDLQKFLKKEFGEEYNVILARNGIEGLDMLSEHEVDIILSDIMMPEMDGIEFCNKVKNSTLWDHIPVVLLTAKHTTESKIKALEYGADAYVEKPFSVEHLKAQIENLVTSRKHMLQKFRENPYITLQSIAGNSEDEEFLEKINEILHENIPNSDFMVEQLAQQMSISESGLYAKVKKLTEITPNKLLMLVRLRKATELLLEDRYRINEICYMVGFNSPSYFSKCFQREYGVLPKDFVKEVISEE